MESVKRTTQTACVTTSTVNNVPTGTIACGSTPTTSNVATSSTIKYTANVPTGTPTVTPTINSSVPTPGASGGSGWTVTVVPTTGDGGIKQAVNWVGDKVNLLGDKANQAIGYCEKKGKQFETWGNKTVDGAKDAFGITASVEVQFKDVENLLNSNYTYLEHYKEAKNNYEKMIEEAKETGQDLALVAKKFFNSLFGSGGDGTTQTVGAVPNFDFNDPSKTADPPNYYGDFSIKGFGANYVYYKNGNKISANVNTKQAGVAYNRDVYTVSSNYNYNGNLQTSVSYASDGNRYTVSAGYNTNNNKMSGSLSYSNSLASVKLDFSSEYLKALTTFCRTNVSVAFNLLNGTVDLGAAGFVNQNGTWFKVTAHYDPNNPGASGLGIGVTHSW